jgi:DNA polymerase III subunit gamma/tau
MVLVRIAYVADLPTPDEAIRMIEQAGGSSAVVAARETLRGSPAPTMSALPVPARASVAPRASAEPSLRPQMAAPAPNGHSEPARTIASFRELVALAGEKRDLLTKSALETDVRLVRFEDGRLEVALEPNAQRSLVNELSRKLELWTGRRWTIVVSNAKGQATLREQSLVEKNERERAAEADPRVQEVLSRFPGTRIIEVRKLAPEPPESDISAEVPVEELDGDDDL